MLDGAGNINMSMILKKLLDSPPLTEVVYQQGEQAWSIEWKEWLPEQAIVIIQKRPEVMLKKELDAILDCLYDGIWITDGQGVTVRVNKALENIANIDAGEVVGRHVLEPRDEGKFSVSVNWLAIQDRKPVTSLDEYWSGKCCLTSSIPVFNDQGEIWRAVATVRDITLLQESYTELLNAKEQVRLYRDELDRLEEERQLGGEFVGNSAAVQKVISTVRRLAKVDSTVLILGETGVGKDVVAKMIHNLSFRADAPFIKVNCGAIPETLIESELFGYEKGSFTGARREGKPGMFELAQGGTIFLDEVAELPLQLQVKLLQAVEEHTIFRIGGIQPVKLNLRIIAATNRNLEEMIAKEMFREDLYYRLKVLPVSIPPLRERKEDIPLLVNHLIKKLNEKMGLAAKRFAKGTVDIMSCYHWPGNVRELRTVIEHLLVMVEGDTIIPDDLPSSLRRSAGQESVVNIQPLKQAVQELEKKIISLAIKQYRNSYEVAKVLQVNQSTVIRKAKKYGIYLNNI
ncbi:sigma-L-dependent transcriptional regulator [Desulfocucumis palustris]|uniref:HTH-type transcriptional regulatory protein TyrR n=1 Tax=Desulfocucumis palustris TaxID=1898651 RepID=A0A2L2XDX3_9FIRM|nr:sigma-L-dependent transcriptional regulator [Desulfocucumis palustris]